MVSYGFKQMLAEANAKVASISVQDALPLVSDDDTLFIDVRESNEQEKGKIAGAVSAPRGFLEFIADPEGPFHNEALVSGKKLVIYCGTGGRSALSAMTLDKMGIENVVNLTGGFAAWNEAGGATESGDG